MAKYTFGKLEKTAQKKDIGIIPIDKPLLYRSGLGEVGFVMGESLSIPFSKTFPQIRTWLDKCFLTYSGKRKVGYSIFCGLKNNIATVTKPLDGDVFATYARNSLDNETLKELLDERGKDCPFVFAVGRGLYSITKSGDLQTAYFYDAAFSKTYFYSPDLQKWVFPIDAFSTYLRKVKMNFKAKDPRDAYIYSKVLIGTDPSTIVADVMTANFAQYQIEYAFSHWEELQDELLSMKAWQGLDPIISESVEHSKELLLSILDSPDHLCAWDLETSGFDFMVDEIGDLSLSNSYYRGIYIPWKHIIENYELACLFSRINAEKQTIGANLKFDMKFVKRAFFKAGPEFAKLAETLQVTFDTNQAGHILNEMRSNGLKTLAWVFTPYGGYDKPLTEYKRSHPWIKSYLKIPDEQRIPYSAGDSAVTYAVHKEEMKLFDYIAEHQDKEDGGTYTLKEYYTDVVMPVTNMFFDMEYEGLCIDIDSMIENEREVKKIRDILENDIKTELFKEVDLPVGYDFDLSSTTQLGKFLEHIALWPDQGRSKNKVYATGDDQLMKWENMGYSVAKKIREYRSWGVALKTFTGSVDDEDGWWQYIRKHEENGLDIIHADFAPGRADSGRNRCGRPNLQNIPARGPVAKKIKKTICPPSEDFFLGSVDFDSLQLKLATIQSKDPTLVKFYTDENNKVDLHSLTAYKIFGSRLFDISYLDVEDENGKIHRLQEKENIKVLRKTGEEEFMTIKEYLNCQLEEDKLEIESPTK